MPQVKLAHFQRAAADIGAHGDNDTLPFDVDSRFVSDMQDDLAQLAFDHYSVLQRDSETNSASKMEALSVFSERLLTPAGSTGFRTTTKIHPFWGIYFNGLGIAIADAFESSRQDSVFSYRFLRDSDAEIFRRESSWKAFRESAIAACDAASETAVVAQTDISSFYESISHHHIENHLNDLFSGDRRVPKQINALLNKFSAGRSFGLPVGGQCSRILAELFLSPVDNLLSESRIVWRRYVDDYILIADSYAAAYKGLALLSHALADYGITLNRTKTIILTSKHFADYVRTQLGRTTDEASKLLEIDLHFDPYSDSPRENYETLRTVVRGLPVHRLLNQELEKAQPDTFLVSQIGRTLRLQEPEVSLDLCKTLLSRSNLNAFRASWSTIMRGINSLRRDDTYAAIFDAIDLKSPRFFESIESRGCG